MADCADMEEGEVNSQEVDLEEESRHEVGSQEMTFGIPTAPSKPTPVAKIALERLETWPDWAEKGHPLYGYPPALQSLWKNATGFIKTFENDADIRDIFVVTHGIEEDGVYPEGTSFTEEMWKQIQDSYARVGYKPHYIEWKIQFDASKPQLPKLVLRFKWLSKPRIVVVQSKIICEDSSPCLSDFLLRPEYVVNSLCKCDAGYTFPNETSKAVLMEEFKTMTFIDLSAIFGFPFKWAQIFLQFQESDDAMVPSFKGFLKGILSCFHHLICTWDDTRGTEMRIMNKFLPYYKFYPWRGVEPQVFKKTFRGLYEHRLDKITTSYPGRLHMASVEFPEFAIFVGSILFINFPAALPCFLVAFKPKSSSDDKITQDILEMVISDINPDPDKFGNTKSSILDLPLHVLQMINLIYHTDDLMIRKPLSHVFDTEDSAKETRLKKQTPGPSCSKKRMRDDKASGSVSSRRKFSKAPRKLGPQSTATKIDPCTSRSCSLPISIRLEQLPAESQKVLVNVSSTTSSPGDVADPEINFADYLLCPDNTLAFKQNPIEPSEEDDDVFYSPTSSGQNSPALESNEMYFDADVSIITSPSTVSASLTNSVACTVQTTDSPQSSAVVLISSSINEFPTTMEVAEQVVVSFDGEIINTMESIDGTMNNGETCD